MNLPYVQLNEWVEEITLQETEIVVREYETKDAKDLTKAGYPFTDTDEWGSPYKDLKLKIISCLEHRSRKRLVAYSVTEKKAVGTVKMDEISEDLWHIGGIFVSPPYRGRGIGSLLYRSAFDCLKGMDVRKAVANVEAHNLPSIRTLEKTWDGFISQSYERYSGITRHMNNDARIGLRSFLLCDLDALYEIYQKSIEAEWRTFLEIDRNNFLERFFGHIHFTGLLRMLVRKRVLVAEEKGTTAGYVIMPTNKAQIHKRVQRLYLFFSPGASIETAISFVRRIFSLLLTEGWREVNLYYTNMDMKLMTEFSDALCTTFGLRKTQFYLAKKNL